MSVRYLKSLLVRSAKIQEHIEHEQKRRWPDQFRLLRMKKIRLAIKDRIMRLVRGRAEAVGAQMRRSPKSRRTIINV
jgi:hypothetical protein